MNKQRCISVEVEVQSLKLHIFVCCGVSFASCIRPYVAMLSTLMMGEVALSPSLLLPFRHLLLYIFHITIPCHAVVRRYVSQFLFFIFVGFGETESTLNVGHCLACCTRPGWWMMTSVERLAGESEVLREILPQGRFVHHKSHITWPGLEPGPLRKVATNRLTYGNG
jgi:hypothetical protein